MKRAGIAHAQLSGLIARLGHTDRVVVGDHGLPLPPGVPLVDLALLPGVLDFCTVLDALLDELVIEAHTLADEAAGRPVVDWLDARSDRLGQRTTVSHTDLKASLPTVAFAVRTGEQTPYSNVVLQCGVPF